MKRGFTYIELTIVVVIICILAAIAVPNFLEARTRSGVSRSIADLAMLSMTLESYRLENHAYPLNTKPGEPEGWDLKALTTPIAYVSALPLDSLTLGDARGRYHPTPMPAIPYRYFNALQLDEVKGLQLEPGPYTTPMPGFHAALLWGYGPASTVPAERGEGSTKLLPGGKVEILAYDPTNGTVSFGDIYQAVP
ncbi:MAG: prepilin-type N-terminal cleavage/methylation domain-containing protein [Candidatus Sumerlaeia bacterium]